MSGKDALWLVISQTGLISGTKYICQSWLKETDGAILGLGGEEGHVDIGEN